MGWATRPAPSVYEHQWNWDSGFLAIGLARYDQIRAQRELSSLFEAQWSNGFVPWIRFNPESPPGYFPGPWFWESWRSRNAPPGMNTAGVSQATVSALAALELYRMAPDRDEARHFLLGLYPHLVREHLFLERERDPMGRGLAYIRHPWEGGLDNSPVWDQVLKRIDLSKAVLPAFQRSDIRVVDPRERPTQDEYNRFAYLVLVAREVDYDESRTRRVCPFLIEDPLFNALWCASSEALAHIARIVGDDPRPHEQRTLRIRNGLLRHLWDKESGFFYARDIRSDRLIRVVSLQGLMPLLVPGLPREVVENLVERTRSGEFRPEDGFGLTSVSTREPTFDRYRYWRGPVWVNLNYLVRIGLLRYGYEKEAERLKSDVLELIKRYGFREYFDPMGERGLGAHRFSWSAALVLDVLS